MAELPFEILNDTNARFLLEYCGYCLWSEPRVCECVRHDRIKKKTGREKKKLVYGT